MKKLILIKLGGSVITDKSKPFTARPATILRLAKEIKAAKEKLGKDTVFILGHGQGSFAHIPAVRYQTQRGLINSNSINGFCETSFMAIEPNRIVMKEFLKVGLSVATFSPLSFLFAKDQKISDVMLSGIKRCFDIGVIPVIYGDVIMDAKQGFCIFSAEKTLGILARELRKDYKIEKIIECGNTDGVYDAEGKTIPEINSKNFEEVKKWITGSKSTDVTGGMIHKVEESLKLAKETGFETVLINGNKKGNLISSLLGERIFGTRIMI